MTRWGWSVAVLLICTAAHAEIYEWRDDAGNRHFTNNKELVPADRQQAARVLVVERATLPASLPAAAPAEPEPRREAQVIYDRSHERDAYAEGISAGLALAAAGSQGETGPLVQINGPLAVANAQTVERGDDYLPNYPFVTTSFDRGRSRHQTLRMLLQDQFQLDRDGPFAYERLNPIGLGPNLQPILPRGLTGRVPRGSRVLFR